MSEMWLHKERRGEKVIEAAKKLAAQYGYATEESDKYLVIKDTKDDALTWLHFITEVFKVQKEELDLNVPTVRW